MSNFNIETLLAAGVFRAAWSEEAVDHFDVVSLADGWCVHLSKDTAAAEAIFRIAGAIDVTVPFADMAKAVTKHIIHRQPVLKDMFESYPSDASLTLLAGEVGATVTAKGIEVNSMEEVIDLTDDEDALRSILLATLDGNCPAARLVHLYGKSGKRTWFNDHFLPTIPFIIHEKNQPVRLVGYQPHPKLHKMDDQGRFVGIEIDEDSGRCLLEFVVSEQSVEGNSFNVAVGAKAAVAGSYTEINSGIPISFSLDRKNARKFSGMGRVVRNLYPDYQSGQTAFVVLDRDNGQAHVELCPANDFDARQKMREMLKEGLQAHNSMSM